MSRFRAKDDLADYRNGYPGQRLNNPSLTANLRFYRNEIKSVPDGDRIEDILQHWATDYELLEVHHGYIQVRSARSGRGAETDARTLSPCATWRMLKAVAVPNPRARHEHAVAGLAASRSSCHPRCVHGAARARKRGADAAHLHTQPTLCCTRAFSVRCN